MFPSLDASGSYERDLLDTRERLNTDDSDASSSLGGLLNWELDMWGRLLSARRARIFETRAAIHDWQGGRLLLSFRVALYRALGGPMNV